MAQLPKGGLNAVAPEARVPQPPPQQGQPPNPAQAAQRISGLEQEVPAEEDFELRVARNLREQQQALNSQMDLLRKTAEKRMNPAFDPALMAAAAGFAKPTKTGGFGESLGYAMENYAAESEKELARKQANDKAMLERLQQQQKMQNQSLLFESDLRRAGYNPEEITTLSSGPAGGSPASGSSAEGSAPAGGAQRQRRPLTQRDVDMAFALGDPDRAKQLMEQLKLEQDRYLSTAQGLVDKRTGKVVDTGVESTIRTSLPFVGVEDVTTKQLAQIRALDEKFPAAEGDRPAHPQRVDQFVRYYYANGIGGVTAPSGSSAPSAGGSPAGAPAAGGSSGAPAGTPSAAPFAGGFSSPSGGGMKTSAQRESERRMLEEAERARLAIIQASEIEAAKKQIDTYQKLKDKIYSDVDNARPMINNAGFVYKFATDPKTQGAFGVLSQGDVGGAIGTLVAEGLSTPGGSIKIAGLENAVRLIKGTPTEIAAAQQLASNYAELELAYRNKYFTGTGGGAISDKEQAVVQRIGGNLSDTAQVAAAKAEIILARARFDQALGNKFYEWEAQNPKSSIQVFKRSEGYKKLADDYDLHMDKLFNKYYGGTAPAGNAPAAPSASPAAPKPQAQPPANETLLEKFKREKAARGNP